MSMPRPAVSQHARKAELWMSVSKFDSSSCVNMVDRGSVIPELPREVCEVLVRDEFSVRTESGLDFKIDRRPVLEVGRGIESSSVV